MAVTNLTREIGHKRPTIYEVAKLAGVSYSTVSRVFSRKDLVSGKAHEKVHNAAKMLGFQPNALARGLKGGSTQTMAVLWSQSEQSLPMIRRITLPIQNRGYTLQLADHLNDPAILKKVLLEYLNRRVDAVVLEIRWNMHEFEQVKDIVKQFPAAVFITDISPEDCLISGVDYISQDHSVAIRQIVQHFVKTGRQRLAFMTKGGYANQHKIDTFNGFAQGHGVERLFFDTTPSHFDDLNEMAPEFIEKMESLFSKQGFKPDAILCDNSEQAAALIVWLKKKGLSVPNDVAVAAREDTSFAVMFDPPLATVRRQHQKVAEAVENMLFKRLKDPSGAQQKMSLPAEFIWRESAG